MKVEVSIKGILPESGSGFQHFLSRIKELSREFGEAVDKEVVLAAGAAGADVEVRVVDRERLVIPGIGKAEPETRLWRVYPPPKEPLR